MSSAGPDVGVSGAPEGQTRWVRWAALAGVCALVIGVFAWSANPGLLALQSSSAQDNYFNLLVRGLRAGQLNVMREAPPGLVRLPDPYDPAANEPYRLRGSHPLDELSYFRGKLYLYFGITPALLLFWPYAVFTGHYLFHKDAALIFFSAGFLASVGLLWSVWRRYFAQVSLGTASAGALCLGLACFTPAILSRSDVWEVAISCGCALTVLSLTGIWFALHDVRRRTWWLAASSLAYGLALGARPSLLPGAVILVAPILQAWRERRRLQPLLLAAAGPILVLGLGLMLYNDLRFDDPLEFGQRYQLVPRRQDAMRQFSLHYLWFNFRVGFLLPARWSGRFPFVQDIAVPAFPGDYAAVEHPFGLLTNLPLVWLALAAPLAWRSRPMEQCSILRSFLAAVALFFGICALTLGLHNSMCLRYEVEFACPAVLLAVVGILGLERTLAGRRAWLYAARFVWGALAVFTVAFNLLLCLARQEEAHNNLAVALLQQGRPDAAIAQYLKAVQLQPGDANAQNNLGYACLQAGRVNEATVHLRRALEIQPDHVGAHVNLGLALVRNGRVDEAMAHFQEALKIQPDDVMARNNLGYALLQQGRVDEAIGHFRKALEIQPGDAQVHYNLGTVLMQQGHVDEAIGCFQRALEIQPDYVDAHVNLGTAFFRKGNAADAITHYQKALAIRPGAAAACAGLDRITWTLATSPLASKRDGAKAVELAEQVNRLCGSANPMNLRTLAAAYAEAGRFPEAVASAQRALQLAVAQTNLTLVDALQIQIRLYQDGSPFRVASPNVR